MHRTIWPEATSRIHVRAINFRWKGQTHSKSPTTVEAACGGDSALCHLLLEQNADPTRSG